MNKVSCGFSMSLDGFIAGRNDAWEHLFAWMNKGDTEFKQASATDDLSLKVSEKSAKLFEDMYQKIGVLVAGRHLFNMTNGWGGKHPVNVPVVVVTHNVPTDWDYPDAPFFFVTDGVEQAIQRAKQIAGEKDVVIASQTILQQCLALGLVDEIHVDLVPVLLGEGKRLIEHLDAPLELERVEVIDTPHVTHLTYRVVR